MADAKHRVVIVGGGFGGLNVALALKRANVHVTLIDRRNFHLFQPLLYQVATGALSPANIAAPLRSVLRNHRNCEVLLGEVAGFDVPGKCVLVDHERIPFDTLVLAAGAGNFYFNHPEWEEVAPGLKSIEEATEIRARILAAFERAELLMDDEAEERKRQLTFVIVGGGPTGVEMAGAVSELALHTLRRDFRKIDPASARIILVEGHDRVLPPFPEKLSQRAKESLQKMRVEVWNSSKVLDIQADHVRVNHEGKEVRIDTATVIWAAGVRASPLGKMIADATGATLDKGARVIINRDCEIPGHPNIFVIGDLAAGTYPDGKPLPGVAPVAMQMGKYVGNVIRARVEGRSHPGPFNYWDKGSMATIGRNHAVVDLYWLRFSGWLAWVTWLFIHITFLIEFHNRLLVLTQWFWNYLTRNRAARLITKWDKPPSGQPPVKKSESAVTSPAGTWK